jgi:hypothetical protein
MHGNFDRNPSIERAAKNSFSAARWSAKRVKNGFAQSANDCVSEVFPPAIGRKTRLRWPQTEGLPLPLGATWIEEEQAFNFAVYAEHAESVTLFLYSAQDLTNPTPTFHFDSLRNKSGRIWYCRIPLQQMRDARYVCP